MEDLSSHQSHRDTDSGVLTQFSRTGLGGVSSGVVRSTAGRLSPTITVCGGCRTVWPTSRPEHGSRYPGAVRGIGGLRSKKGTL